MKYLITLAAIGLAGTAVAQTKSLNSGALPYDSNIDAALSCMANAPGDAAAQDNCIVEAIEECRSKAGVYESCLAALHDGYSKAIERVLAEENKVCNGKLDQACHVVLRGHALMRTGQGLTAQQWGDALSGAE